MNVIALIASLLGLAVVVATVVYSKNTRNKWYRYLTVGISIVVALGVASLVPAMLGDADTNTSFKAGEYLVYGLIGYAILQAVRSKKQD